MNQVANYSQKEQLSINCAKFKWSCRQRLFSIQMDMIEYPPSTGQFISLLAEFFYSQLILVGPGRPGPGQN